MARGRIKIIEHTTDEKGRNLIKVQCNYHCWSCKYKIICVEYKNMLIEDLNEEQ